MLSTLAAQPAADRVLRSLAVTLGGALLFKFVVLSGVAAPGGSLAKRLFATALEGITLGALGATYQPVAAGYLAFAALCCCSSRSGACRGDQRESMAPAGGAPSGSRAARMAGVCGTRA